MKYALLMFMYIFAILSWVNSDKTNLSFTFIALSILTFALILQLFLEKRTQDEMSILHERISELHEVGTATSSFELFLNEKKIDKKQHVLEIDAFNKDLPLVLTLKNIGNSPSEDLQVHLWIPNEIKNIHLGKHWRNMGPPIFKQNTIEGVTNFLYTLNTINIHPQNTMSLGKGRIEIPENGKVPLRLKLYAKGVFQEWTFAIKRSK